MPKPAVTFQVLREIAEAASGMRDKDVYFVVKDGNPVTIHPHFKPQNPSDDTVVIHCAPVCDPILPVGAASIAPPGGRPIDLLNIQVPGQGPHPGGGHAAADAVFWSISAVEKFLVPYYASVYGDDGPRIGGTLLDLLLQTGLPKVQRPFAVAHLPSSEYVPVAEPGQTVVPHLALLTPAGARPAVGGFPAQGRARARARASGSRST